MTNLWSSTCHSYIASLWEVNRRGWWVRLAIIVLGGLILFGQSHPAGAQDTTPNAYWVHPAPDIIQSVITGDITGNGIDEFIVASVGGRIDLVNAGGNPIWQIVVSNQTPIRQINTLQYNGATHILITTAEELILISPQSTPVWQQSLDIPSPPTALITGGGDEAERWQDQFTPVLTQPINRNNDGNEDILVAYQSGLLQLYSAQTGLQWAFPDTPNTTTDTSPDLFVGDLDSDGLTDILYNYLDGNDILVRLDANGNQVWRESFRGRVTALTAGRFEPQEDMRIIIGRSPSRTEEQAGHREQVQVFDANRNLLWFRTPAPQSPISSVTLADLPAGRAVVVGTASGIVATYDQSGNRFWQRQLANTPGRAILSISPSPAEPRPNQTTLAVSLSLVEDSDNADLYLLDGEGRIIQEFPTAVLSAVTQLSDINQDGLSELITAFSNTLELHDPGTGARSNAADWAYRANPPDSMLVADVDRDGRDELLIGTNDGRLHMIEGETGTLSFLQNIGDSVPFIGLADPAGGESPLVVTVSHDRPAGDDAPLVSTIRLFNFSNNLASPPSITLDEAITSLAVADLNTDSQSDILVGTESGKLIAYALDMTELWRAFLPSPAVDIAFVQGNIFALTNTTIYRFDGTGTRDWFVFFNLESNLIMSSLPSNEDVLLVTADDNIVRKLALDGRQTKTWPISAENLQLYPAGNEHLIIANNAIYYLDPAQPSWDWTLSNLGEITSLFWGNLSGGGEQDLAIGTAAGTITLYNDERRQWDTQVMDNSPIVGLTGIETEQGQPLSLLAINANGVTQFFTTRPNRPPLLFNPRAEALPGQFNISVDVIGEPNETIQVTLELFDIERGGWSPEARQSASGEGPVSFVIPAEGDAPVRYRFVFDDTAHQGRPTSQITPVPLVVNPAPSLIIGPAMLFAGVLGGAYLIRQRWTPQGRARRAYRHLRQQPTETLVVIANLYETTAGSPDVLLSLANQARQDNNGFVAGLADGLFLLSARPGAALELINNTLHTIQDLSPSWHNSFLWHGVFNMCQALLEAPNITELSLLRPRFVQLIRDIGEDDYFSGLDILLRVLSNLRDSERVDRADDRLVYLYEANVLLEQGRGQLQDRPVLISTHLLQAVMVRLQGMVNAAIDELRGQANLVVHLKTKRLVDVGKETTVVLNIHNNGRAPAETVMVRLNEDPAYTVQSMPQLIGRLAPGRDRQVTFTLEPHVADRFRLACHITFDDHSQNDRHADFADMVHLLPPTREFTPIINPYLPGTPLRSNSKLFFGRNDLFEFIAQSAGQISQRNVLILVGQRRTGKTSALLRLGDHLPEHLLPVYIDCQSLGVTEGMDALFHDWAWYIADALSLRGYDVDVPEPEAWRDDPVGQLQRHFLPYIRTLLPEGTILMLVFDEFEAFENLVNDNILPRTFFTFLRHLMQHSEGLSFVFVGTHRLEEMTMDYWSVLFNIALYKQISFLEHSATLDLVCDPVAPHIVYDDLALDKIWRVTAGQPYFLQLVCYTLINQANKQRKGYITISDVNSALEDMLKLGEVHFAYIWQRSTFIERALLAAIAHLMEQDVPFHPSDLIQYLEQYGFRFDPTEVVNGLNTLVERDIMQEVNTEGTTLYELKIGLVGLWAAQNKSLSKLYESQNSSRPVPSLVTSGL